MASLYSVSLVFSADPKRKQKNILSWNTYGIENN
jgi:hypothetical protein